VCIKYPVLGMVGPPRARVGAVTCAPLFRLSKVCSVILSLSNFIRLTILKLAPFSDLLRIDFYSFLVAEFFLFLLSSLTYNYVQS